MRKKKKKRSNRGKLFEKHIQDSLRLEEIFYYRLRDSSASWGGDNGKARFTTTNIADFMVQHSGTLFIVEAKTTKGKSLPFSNIRESQIKGLRELEKFNEVIGVFIIEFSEEEERYMVSSKKVINYIDTAERKSLPISFFQEEAYLLEAQKNKRVLMKMKEGMNEMIKEREKEKNFKT